jgi:transposase
MKKTAIYKWVIRFSEGIESVSDEERSGRPRTRELKKALQKFIKLCVKIVG